MPTILFTPPSSPSSYSPRASRTPSPASPSSPASPILLTPHTPSTPAFGSAYGGWTPTKMSPTDTLSTSKSTARSHHTTPSGGSPILRSAPLVNPATANIVLPDIILNSPPASRRGSHVHGIAEAAASVTTGVLHGLGLSVATLPSLAQFKWTSDARRHKDRKRAEYGESTAGSGDEEWNVEGRRSRSTSPKYILPSFIPNQPYPLHGANDSRTHIAAISAPTDGPYKSSSKSKRKYKANSKYTKHRAHWVRQVRVNDDDGEEEVGAWLVIFMMVVAVMALAYLSSMLSGESGEYAMDVGGMGEDKVIGWGKADGQRKWHVKRAGEVLGRINKAHTLDWEDGLHHDIYHDHAEFDNVVQFSSAPADLDLTSADDAEVHHDP